MPTWDELQQQVEEVTPFALLKKGVQEHSKKYQRSVIAYLAAFTIPKPNISSHHIVITDQDMQGFMTCSKGTRKELDLILHTPGGDYEATKRIIYYLRDRYDHIRVFVPHMAMSGGTMIACAADEIWMGPYSSLGPTDPQIQLGGRFVPVGAVLQEFKQAFEEVSQDPSTVMLWRERINMIPFGMIDSIENMLKNAHGALADILRKGAMRGKDEESVEKAAALLNTHQNHTTHGAGLNLEQVLDIGLNVQDLGQDKTLEDSILSIYHAATILFERSSLTKIVMNEQGRVYDLTSPSS